MRKIVLIFLLFLLLFFCFSPLLLGGFYVNNVFDEIYYSCVQNSIFRLTNCNPNNMDGIILGSTSQSALTFKKTDQSIFSDLQLWWNKSDSVFYGERHVGIMASLPIKDTVAGFTGFLIMEYVYYPNTQTLVGFPLSIVGNVEAYPTVPLGEINRFITDAQTVAHILEKSNITREDIRDFRDQILFQEFLPNWFATNSSNFDVNDIGKYINFDRSFELIDSIGK